MLELWNSAGFYLWALTTALVVIALAWLAFNAFAASADSSAVAPAGVDPTVVDALGERVTGLAEAHVLIDAIGVALTHRNIN